MVAGDTHIFNLVAELSFIETHYLIVIRERHNNKHARPRNKKECRNKIIKITAKSVIQIIETNEQRNHWHRVTMEQQKSGSLVFVYLCLVRFFPSKFVRSGVWMIYEYATRNWRIKDEKSCEINLGNYDWLRRFVVLSILWNWSAFTIGLTFSFLFLRIFFSLRLLLWDSQKLCNWDCFLFFSPS